MSTITELEPGVVGKEFLKLLKSDDITALVIRRLKGEDDVAEIHAEPWVDGRRQHEIRYSFPAITHGAIFSHDGHASTIRPKGAEVVGTAILYRYDIRDFVNLIRVGDKLLWEFQGANNSELTRKANLNLNEVFLVIERNGKRLCRLLVEARIEQAGGFIETVHYV